MGIGIAGALVGGVLVLRRAVWVVYALVLSVPVQQAVLIGGRVSPTQAIMVGGLFAWWAWMAVGQRRIVLPPFALALGAYIAVMGLSLVVATSLSEGLAEIARWLVVLLAYIIIVNTVRTRAEVWGLVACCLAGAGAEGALGLWQVFRRQVPESFYVGQGGDPADLAPRAFGTIGMPNSYAGYLNLTLALALALTVYFLWRATRHPVSGIRHPISGVSNLNSKLKIQNSKLVLCLLPTAYCLLVLGGLVLSYSRGGYLGLALGVLAMAVALGRRAAPALIGLGVAGAVAGALLVAGALPTAISERIGSILSQVQIYDVRGVEATPETFNQIERLAHWQAAGNMYLSDPWLGVGIGNFNVVYPRFAVPGWPVSRGHAHNYYLHALAETGLAGLLAYTLVLLAAIGGGWRAIRRARHARRGWETAVLIGAFGVVLTIAGHSIFENLHVLNLGIHWAAVIALFKVVDV